MTLLDRAPIRDGESSDDALALTLRDLGQIGDALTPHIPGHAPLHLLASVFHVRCTADTLDQLDALCRDHGYTRDDWDVTDTAFLRGHRRWSLSVRRCYHAGVGQPGAVMICVVVSYGVDLPNDEEMT